MLDSFDKRTFTAPLSSGHTVSHDVYSKDDAGRRVAFAVHVVTDRVA